jgi:hypothetical protein
MRSKQPKTKPAAKPTAPRLPSKKPEPVSNIRIPAWVDEEPDKTESYHLIAERSDAWDQAVELTRSEYLSLKDRLAEMRGYAVPAEAAHA